MVKSWVITLIGISALYLSSLEAFFCSCIPKDHPDFRVFVAPQVARLKLSIEKFAIYRGVVKGASAGIEYKPYCSFYGGIFAEWMMGPTSSQMQMSRYIHDFDTEARLGYNIPMWNFYSLTFTPYFGIGYIQEVHHIRPDNVLSSLIFRYSNYYLPYGCIIDFYITKHFAFGFVVEKKKCIQEYMKSPFLQGIEFILNQRSGYLFEVPVFLKFGNAVKFEISIVPYIKREIDGMLNASLPDGATFSLPKQDYRYWGMRLGVGAVF